MDHLFSVDGISSSSSSNINNGNDVIKKEIRLPGPEYALFCWKVKDDSLVQSGDTVALAIHKKNVTCKSSNNKMDDDKAATVLVDTTTTTTTTKYKRPKKRNRKIITGAAMEANKKQVGSIATKERNHNNKILSSSLMSSLSKKITGTATIDAKDKSHPSTETVEKKVAGPATTHEDSKRKENDKSIGKSTTTTTKTKTTTTTAMGENMLSSVQLKSTKDITEQTVPLIAPIDGFVRTSYKKYNLRSNHDEQAEEDPLIIGCVVPCSHPTVIEGLCVVCGKSQKNASMSQVTVSGVTVTVSEREGKRMALQSSRKLRNQKKLSLVLDLDHTLVHATADRRAGYHLEREDVRSIILPMMEEDNSGGGKTANNSQRQHLWMQHYVKLRPYVKQFLETLQPLFEISVYTAGTRQYAEQITTILCRYLVGAVHDEVQLGALRHQVEQAEKDLQRQKQKQSNAGQESETKSSSSGVDTSREDKERVVAATKGQEESQTTEFNKGVVIKTEGQEESRETECNRDDNDSQEKKRSRVSFKVESDCKQEITEDSDEPPSKKRKRVTFHEPKKEETYKTTISPEDLEKMRQGLAEAEKLEAKATTVRQSLFGSRIVSRTDVGDLGRDVKSLTRIFPCGGTMAAVVDDREDVWANAGEHTLSGGRKGEPPENVLLVRPYHWQPFLGFADVNNSSGVDLSGQSVQANEDDPTAESDEQLMWTCDILQRLHKRYYSSPILPDNPKTVQYILREMRSEVLRGTKIVLSGLVPLHQQNIDLNSSSPRPSVVRYTEWLGSIAQPSVRRDTSFVVAAKDGTDKTLAGRKIHGCSVVKVSWLMECLWSLTRRDIQPHLFEGSVSSSRKEIIVKEESDDDDGDYDDDFTAEFEKELM